MYIYYTFYIYVCTHDSQTNLWSHLGDNRVLGDVKSFKHLMAYLTKNCLSTSCTNDEQKFFYSFIHILLIWGTNFTALHFIWRETFTVYLAYI